MLSSVSVMVMALVIGREVVSVKLAGLGPGELRFLISYLHYKICLVLFMPNVFNLTASGENV